ncbi:MAG: hypothetical protein WCF36_08050 [Candidatus Nanopelagicales bacterium]
MAADQHGALESLGRTLVRGMQNGRLERVGGEAPTRPGGLAELPDLRERRKSATFSITKYSGQARSTEVSRHAAVAVVDDSARAV